MRFKNAYAGVSKIFSSEILMLISTVLMSLAVIFAGLGKSAASVGNEGAEGIFLIIDLGLMLLSIVLMIVAGIFAIIGFSKAALDEKNFKIALFIMIVSIGTNILGNAFSEPVPVLSTVFYAVSELAELLVTIYAIMGIMNLASKLNNGDMVRRGSTLLKALTVVYLLSAIAVVIAKVFGINEPTAVITIILNAVSAIIMIVAYVLWLIYLTKTKKMLAKS